MYSLILCLSLLGQTQRIHCGVEDDIIYVECKNTDSVIGIFKEAGIKHVGPIYAHDENLFVVGKWIDKKRDYKHVRDTLFKLVRGKNVIRIY